MKKNKLLLLLLSIVTAIAMWLYVVTVISPESEKTFYDVPVKFTGTGWTLFGDQVVMEDKGLMIVMEETPTVDVTLSGNRIDLNQLSNTEITVTLDLSQIYEEGTESYKYEVDVGNDAISIIDQSPARVSLTVESFSKQSVDVEVVFGGQDPDDYVVLDGKDEAKSSVEEITVMGPTAVVEKLSRVQILVDKTNRTENIDVTLITDSLNERREDGIAFQLLDVNGEPLKEAELERLTFLTEEITVTVPVHRVVEVELYVELLSGGGANASNTTYTLSPYDTIKVHGREADLANLPEDLRLCIATIDLSQVLENMEETYTVNLPEGLTNMTMIGSNEVKLTLTLPELDVRSFEIPAENFRVDNLPEGLEIQYNGIVTVTLRGPQALLERLEAEDITVILNAEGKSAGGNQRIWLTFELPLEYTELVGAIGTYPVYVNIIAKE